MAQSGCVIGVDYGTDSVRSIVVDTEDGHEVASAVHYYQRWKKGNYCDPSRNRFRQHPLDYIEGLEKTVTQALAAAPSGTAHNVRGLSVDTTGSTPVAVDKNGNPLALLPGFEENPNAMFILWKDHTAVEEASLINEHARTWGGIDFTKYVGGVYSSEWFWAKILHILREDENVRRAAFSWVEHCDWIPALLTGNNDPLAVKRSRCAAGHKAMWHKSFGGLPSEEFLAGIDPLLKGVRDRLYHETHTSDAASGTLSKEWAGRLGLSPEVVVGVGAFDAHMGAIGGEIDPYILTKIIGTSTCDMLIAPLAEIGDKLIPGICGQVDGSIIPGMLGMEAGQSCVGDVYAWFRDLLLWPLKNAFGSTAAVADATRETLVAEIAGRIIPELSKAAATIPAGESDVVALDWLNGRRTPYANQRLHAAIAGLDLGADAVRIFRSLVEATAFGAKKIVDRFVEEGISIKGVIALGGVAKKAPFVMQVHADVLNMPIRVARAEQACALGAAMCAAVASGVHPSMNAAQKAMGNGFEREYRPISANVEKYREPYETYTRLGRFVEDELTR
ncbi:MAG: ribulokinase [Chitinispirillaceae bacterium]|nr:ribulokinase [Chitinispirillaceae bacterium]